MLKVVKTVFKMVLKCSRCSCLQTQPFTIHLKHLELNQVGEGFHCSGCGAICKMQSLQPGNLMVEDLTRSEDGNQSGMKSTGIPSERTPGADTSHHIVIITSRVSPHSFPLMPGLTVSNTYS